MKYKESYMRLNRPLVAKMLFELWCIIAAIPQMATRVDVLPFQILNDPCMVQAQIISYSLNLRI